MSTFLAIVVVVGSLAGVLVIALSEPARTQPDKPEPVQRATGVANRRRDPALAIERVRPAGMSPSVTWGRSVAALLLLLALLGGAVAVAVSALVVMAARFIGS